MLGFLSVFNDFVVHCRNIKGESMVELVFKQDHLYFQQKDKEPETIGLLPPVSKIDIQNVHVLINNETASCGELLTYLLKKQHNATIYGEPSYGLSTWMEYYEIPGLSLVSDEVTLRYPELIFDFSDSNIKMVKTKKYKDTPVFSIAPDKENIPFKEFGMF
jgi:hypothetical protein